MDDAALVCVTHRFTDLNEKSKSFAAGKTMKVGVLGQWTRARDELHDEVRARRSRIGIEVGTGVVDLGNPRVAQVREELCFVLKPSKRVRRCDVGAHHFERDCARGMLLKSLIDLAHAAGTDEFLDAVLANAFRDGEAGFDDGRRAAPSRGRWRDWIRTAGVG